LLSCDYVVRPPRHLTASAVHAGEYWADGLHASYALDRNDQAFYFVRRLPVAPSKIVLVRNWFQELKARVPR
jgi:hypothetical protein